MKYFDLDKDEEKILNDFEAGKLVRRADLVKAKRLYRKYTQQTLNKTKNINIRLSQKDLLKLKAKAVREGIPYQTLATSILHRSAT